MNIQSVAIASGTEAGPAEAMVKAAASTEETEDGDSAAVTTVETANVEDSGVMTVLAAKIVVMQRTAGSDAVTDVAETTEAPVPLRTEDAAEVTAAKTEENGTTETGKTQIVSPPQREQREKQKSERNGKSRASVTASLKGNDLN